MQSCRVEETALFQLELVALFGMFSIDWPNRVYRSTAVEPRAQSKCFHCLAAHRQSGVQTTTFLISLALQGSGGCDNHKSDLIRSVVRISAFPLRRNDEVRATQNTSHLAQTGARPYSIWTLFGDNELVGYGTQSRRESNGKAGSQQPLSRASSLEPRMTRCKRVPSSTR